MKATKEKIQKSGQASANNEKAYIEYDLNLFLSWCDQTKIEEYKDVNFFTEIAREGSIGNPDT